LPVAGDLPTSGKGLKAKAIQEGTDARPKDPMNSQP
jgi:hypothetical protein